MAKIYVPNYTTGMCAYINNNNTIRVYETQPRNNATINYTDYYFNSHYYYNRGYTTFSNYSTLPTCLYDSDITTDYYYRNDFSDILLIFAIIVFFCWYMLSLLIKKLLKGRKYL